MPIEKSGIIFTSADVENGVTNFNLLHKSNRLKSVIPRKKGNQDKKPALSLRGSSYVGQACEPPFKGRAFYRLGTLLLIISILGIALTFGPVLLSEAKYQATLLVQRIFVRQETQTYFGDLLQLPALAEKKIIPDKDFSIIIPKIGARAKIVANVDAGREGEYLSALKEGVAHAKGSVFPGMKGNIYLFAHSTDSPLNITRYNAIFYLLFLISESKLLFRRGSSNHHSRHIGLARPDADSRTFDR